MRIGDAIIDGGATITAAWVGVWGAWHAGRRRERASFVQAVQEAAHLAIKDLTDLAGTLREEIKRVTGMRDEVAAHHEECRRELRRSSDERAAMQRQIDKLMDGPVASYSDRPPTDDTD